MNPSHEKPEQHRKAACLVGAVIFFSFIYFYEGGGWNQNSRFDLLRAIVEKHTLQIDALHENTQDKAHYNGHYYSDKAPGLVFLAVPVAMAVRPALRAVGVEPESARGEVALSYFASAFAVALPTALAGVVLFFLGLRFGAGTDGAAFGAIVMGLGTPMWAYASLFWAHALVGACLLFALAAALKIGESGEGSRDFLWAFAVGIAAGWATVTEYPAAPASATLAVMAITRVWRQGSAARWRVIGGVGLGAGLCLIVLLSYLYAAFGSLRPSYSYYDPNSFSFMQTQGYMGLTYPHPDRLLKLLFGCSRGLFFASPVLLAAVAGLWWMRKGPGRAAVVTASAIVAYYFLFNASFYWWKAGLTFGPRYAGASFPLVCLGLACCWERAGVMWRRVLIVLALCSVGVALMTIATSSQLSMQDSCPIVHSVWPEFWAGKMAINRESMLTAGEANGKYGAFNLGQLIGLNGLASLITLIAAWGAATLAWVRMQQRVR